MIKDYDLKVGDGIFTYNGGWLNRAIFWFSKEDIPDSKEVEIAHVALYIGKLNGKDMLAEADWKGITIRKIDKYNSSKYHIFVARPKISISAEEEILIKNYADSYKGANYSYAQIVALAFKRLLHLKKVGDWDKDAFICSEFYASAIKRCLNFAIVQGIDTADLTPLAIYASDRMDKIKT